MKKKMIFMVAIVLALSFVVSVPAEAKSKPKLSAKSKTMYVGKTTTIKLKNAGKVKWKTSKKSVVSISKKKKNKVWIKAKKAGTATITATYKKKTYKCRITVKEKKEYPVPEHLVQLKAIFEIGFLTYLSISVSSDRDKTGGAPLECDWRRKIVFPYR